MAENENTFLNADNIYEEVEGESGKALNLMPDQKLNLAGLISSRFQVAEDSRQIHERRWLTAYQNYRGLYGKKIRFRESEKSRVFVKVTKTKVLAAFGQLIDVIFGTGKFPIGIRETKMPEGEVSQAHLDTQNPVPGIETTPGEPVPIEQQVTESPYAVGYEGDGRVLKPGATYGDGKFEERFIEELAKAEGNYVEGFSPIPQELEISPAQKAARRMEKLIHDQIEESNGSSELRNALFESSMMGTGIIKGPFNFNKTLNKWDEEEDGTRTYNPLEVRVPRIEFVSLWDFFPDPNATSMEECEYIVHRHRLNRSQFRALSKMPYFDKDAIRDCLMMGGNYEKRSYEDQIRGEEQDQQSPTQYEVLEYWGIMDAEYAREVGIELDDSIDDLDEVQINAWISDNKVLRVVVNPFTPYRIPYHAFPYEKNPYSFFGVGVAENMDDSQQIMNGHARMAIDNLALSGSLLFDVDESALVCGQSFEKYPSNIFRRQA